jgi:hypothetical protein
MSFGSIAVISCLATIAIGMGATQPLELRHNRWWRIALSLPVVLLIVSVFWELAGIRGYFALWGVAILGFIWMGPMAHAATTLLQPILFGDLNRNSGIRAEFAGAKALRQHGDIAEALKLTEEELAKEPLNYEGLLLLAELCHESGHHSKAVKALDLLLTSRALTPAQRRLVSEQRLKLQVHPV